MKFSDLDGARVGVWGAGREIASFAEQLSRRLLNAKIVAAAFDGEPPAGLHDTLRAPTLVVLDAAQAPATLAAACDVVVRSPGVSIHRPEIEALRAHGVPVTTATGLWLAERGGTNVIGVTGTKGKSTTAALTAHLLRHAGVDVRLAGNIGVPALDLLDVPAATLAVVELSSYQIADLEQGPETAVVTNLFPEHLDWHGSHESYEAEKLRLALLPGVRRRVLNARQPQVAALASENDQLFGQPDGFDEDERGVMLAGELLVPAAELPLRGAHNALNLCAALAAVVAHGAALPELPAALDGFEPLPHRLQTVAQRDGVEWVDDSISTTPESALAALESFGGRDLVLIAGGQDRGQDYEALGRALADRGASLIALPTTGPRLAEAARTAGVDGQRIWSATDLADAVKHAAALAPKGGVVLLSPAAPSYDHFRDFEDRGEQFSALAREAAALP